MKFITVTSLRKNSGTYEETDVNIEQIESMAVASPKTKMDYPEVNSEVNSVGFVGWLVKETLPEIRAKIAAAMKES